MERERCVRSEQARVEERPDQQQEGRRVATRVGDALRASNRVALSGREFGETVDPALGDAVRGAGIEQPYGCVFCPGGGFACCVVGKTQDRDVGGTDCGSSRCGVLALRLRERRDHDVSAALEELADAQAGRADGAIEKDPGLHAHGG